MDDRVWEPLSRTLRTSVPYRRLLGRLAPGLSDRAAPGATADVVRLPVAAAAWVGDLLAADLGRPLLALVPSEADALAWLEGAQLVAPGAAIYFPAPSLSPYQETEPSLLVRAQEAVALDRILAGRARAVVATPRALFRRLPAAADFAAAVLEVRSGDDLPPERLAGHLLARGYHRTDLVSEVGELAIRGGVFDLFPPGEELPLRLDFFGDTIDSIRRFDPHSQRSEERVDSARLLPLSLFPSGADEARALAEKLPPRLGWELSADGARHLEDLRLRGGYPGWEGLLPALAPATAGLEELIGGLDGGGALAVAVDPPALAAEAEHHEALLAADYAARREHGKLALPPEAVERPAGEVQRVLAGAAVAVRDLVLGAGAPAAVAAAAASGDAGPIDFAATTTDLFQGQLPRFPQEVATARDRGDRCLVVVAPGHRERMEQLLEGREIALGAGGCELVEGDLTRGFRLPAAGASLYGEAQLLPRAKPQRPSGRRARYGPFVSSLRDLKPGDYVVHGDHGIGQFVGLRRIDGDGDAAPLPPALAAAGFGGGGDGLVESEVMEIGYAGGQRLLLPLSRLDLVQKFSGLEGTAPRLDKLGGTSWNKTKERVRKSLRDMAGELIELYAERQVAEAPVLPPESDLARQFAAAFAYEETPDQLEAIAAISEDLERSRPMDRLLCGDVGYGKTEVAMRAAFKAVDGGYQVAVLAPTTILADQHLETFQERFKGFPVTVDMISRFRTPEEVREIKKGLAAGKIDVLIGTHRLLSRDVELPKLGLLIVDEEQRFGVAQKERLKKLKKNVHVLALSATPVPRTLQLSLSGVRDLSVIETPPKDRMAVETAILPFDAQLVREAIEFEIGRGGQVYYVYNRVETIERMLATLRKIVPGVRVTVGHGQLDEQELMRRMHAFHRGEHDVLLASTIIENGIDIPNVNTMIVHRADRFGLAQLYQLRGRVGRSSQLAYCYLLVPGDRILSEAARKRLAAIREFTDLGAGFRIAARDLEIRGAGNLLGAEQSGHIAAVGIETYLKMLEDAVRELRGEAVEEAPSVALDLPVAMAIPESYIADANLRMEVYRKIAAGDAGDEELLAELTDRFGAPPPEVVTLLEVGRLKRVAEALRVQAVSARGDRLTIRLRRDARVDVEKLIGMVSERPGASFSPTGVLTLTTEHGDAVGAARRTLEELAA
jgi:transcription-repair coupling factor (superfamily II helicase)